MARSADGGGSSVTLTPTQIALKKALAAQKVAQNAVNNVAKKGTPKQKLVAAEKLRLARSATAFATSNNDATLTFGTASEETNFLMEAAASQAATGNAQATLADDGSAPPPPIVPPPPPPGPEPLTPEQIAANAAANAATEATNAGMAERETNEYTAALEAEWAASNAAILAEEQRLADEAVAQAKADQDAANLLLQELTNAEIAATAAELAAAKAALDAANEAAKIAAKAAAEAADKAAAAAARAASDAAMLAKQEAATREAAVNAAKAAGDLELVERLEAEREEAETAAEAAAVAAQQALDKAVAEAEAKAAAAAATAAAANINVTGNTVIPGAYATAADLEAAVDKATAKAAAKADQAAAQQKADTAAALEAKKIADRTSVIETMKVRFKQYNLGSLADKITSLAIDGANEATITLALQETEEYKKRFSANEARLKNNLQVLAPAAYLNAEDGYRQVLNAYGLNQFATDDYVKKFIENDLNPQEMNTRVSTAVNRIQNADPATMKLLRDNYNIKATDLVAYTLDPTTNINTIQQQISGAEISNAGATQGLTVGVGVADQLVAQGVTQARAQKGYAAIADILPGAEKLSNIYGKTQDIYGQAEGEQEEFNSLASAQRKRLRLEATEKGTFGASSGMSRSSLTGTKPAGQY